MKQKFQQFMIGRHGMDALGRFLNIVVLAVLLLGIAFPQLVALSIVLLVYQYYRVFSKNSYKRNLENNAYLGVRRRVLGWFTIQKQRFLQRKEYRFFTCSSCRQTLRVPRGKGKIMVTCPKCRTKSTKKS